MAKTANQIYADFLEEKNKKHIEGYLEWKKGRKAKQEQTKTLRKQKAQQKEAK